MSSNIIHTKINLRKAIARIKRSLKNYDIDRHKLFSDIGRKKAILKALAYAEMGIELPGAPAQTFRQVNNELPNFGKLLAILRKEVEEEQNKFDIDAHQSDNDIKRLALKEAVLEYYNDLGYNPEEPIVDYNGDLTLRRDDNDVDGTDLDFAPNKNNIYNRWMEKLRRYIKDSRLNSSEYDEAAERGIPQGGAFEKQLDRYRKDFMKRLWQDHYQQEESL